MIRANLIIGWSTDTIHALHKYAYNLKSSFHTGKAGTDARIVTCSRLFAGGIGEELTNYFKYPVVVNKFKNAADINHITSQEFAYLGFLGLKNLVVTVHDIFPITLDAKYTRFNYKFRIWLGLKAMKKAKAIICNSQFTEDSIIKRGIDKEKCRVIPMGFDQNKYKVTSPANIHKKLGLDKEKKYILHVGSENERKNIVRLIQALAMVAKKNKDVVLLRIGKVQNDAHHAIIGKEIKKQGMQNHIKYVGQLNDEDLVRLYNFAKISVFPSLYEGFGMPIIESFACGCPCVASSGPPMKETARNGEAALIPNPYSAKDIAEKIELLLNSKGLQKKLAQKGLKHAKEYAWKNIAEKTRKVYETVLENRV